MTQAVGRTRRSVCRLRTDVAKTVSPDQQNPVGSVQQEQDRAKNGPHPCGDRRTDRRTVRQTDRQTDGTIRVRRDAERPVRTHGTGRPGTSGTTAAPFQTDRKTFSGAESSVA